MALKFQLTIDCANPDRRIGATRVRVLETEGLDHYAMAMRDPEGNGVDLN